MSLPEVPESKLLGYRFKKYSLRNLSRLIRVLKYQQKSAPQKRCFCKISKNHQKTFFILLKAEKETVVCKKYLPITNGEHEELLKTLNKFSKTLRDEEISLHIAILDSEADKAEIKKLESYFNQYERIKEEHPFWILNNILWKTTPVVLTFLFAFFILIVSQILFSAHIPYSFISIETIAFVVKSLFSMKLFAILTIPTLFLIILMYIFGKIKVLPFLPSRDHLRYLKFMSNVTLLVISGCLILIFNFHLEKDQEMKKSFISAYLQGALYPSLNYLTFKNNDSKLVLIMGIDNAIIHYIEDKLIEQSLKGKKEVFCNPNGLDKHEYSGFIAQLLLDISSKDFQWYSKTKLSDVAIDPKMPNYKEAFCE